MPLRATTSPYKPLWSSACQGSTLDNMVLWSHGLGGSLEECKGGLGKSTSWEVWGLEVGVYSNMMMIPEGASSFRTKDEVGPCHVSAAQGQPGALGSLHCMKASHFLRFRHSFRPEALRDKKLVVSTPLPLPAAKLPWQSLLHCFR